ncbi:tripartite tricarboxylate transporter substrate binding protein [Bosea sp. 117]|uniref:Bug family tripartite tricarboxylate transporter substrate binding protein n=1 Tax=Bosea sp. 117 TaxID=1125973 RepID=UPI000493FC66|nr:tripartite tricarboxylate transporter substrate binding protein [Bosea sp. 117]
MKHIRTLLCGLVAATFAVGAAFADTYPSKPVKILVPYAPGGATDIVARLLADRLREALGQSFVVDNKQGAFGILAIEEMARSKPDGYTLMVGNVSTNAITPVIYSKKFKIDYQKDVVAVARLAVIPAVVVSTTAGGFDAKTLGDLIAYAKANPGKLRYTSAGVGSYPHFDMAVFAKKAGFEAVHVPTKAGAAGMINDLITGDVQTAFINAASSLGVVKSGDLRPLAVITKTRMKEYPDVPTMTELGFAGVGTFNWQGLFAPAGTPKEVLATLHKAVAEALAHPAMVEAFQKQIITADPSKSPEDAQAWLASEIELWRKTVAEANVSLE